MALRLSKVTLDTFYYIIANRNAGAELYEKLLTRRRQQQQCDEKECVRGGLQSDENLLYQVLQHGWVNMSHDLYLLHVSLQESENEKAR